MSEIGEIPQSPALAEADPFSLTELMSRNPESYQKQDLQNIVAALRADRARRELAERTAAEGGKSKGARVSKAEAGPVVPLDMNKLGL